ncbi:unnamed protein product, partial [marine sediment metagenome]
SGDRIYSRSYHRLWIGLPEAVGRASGGIRMKDKTDTNL